MLRFKPPQSIGASAGPAAAQESCCSVWGPLRPLGLLKGTIYLNSAHQGGRNTSCLSLGGLAGGAALLLPERGDEFSAGATVNFMLCIFSSRLGRRVLEPGERREHPHRDSEDAQHLEESAEQPGGLTGRGWFHPRTLQESIRRHGGLKPGSAPPSILKLTVFPLKKNKCFTYNDLNR